VYILQTDTAKEHRLVEFHMAPHLISTKCIMRLHAVSHKMIFAVLDV